ncbi:MAG: nitroreductase family protein [Candidatus Caldatribacteriaceae bacterium]
MNEVIATIKRQRSIRSYRPEQISESELQAILESALYAPSAMNQQKWRFIVVQNRDLLWSIAEATREAILTSGIAPLVERAKNPGFNVFYHAPTVVFVFADKNARFATTDAALAAQNMLIAAESLNIGSCIMALPELAFTSERGEKLKEELGIPGDHVYVCAIALGYKTGENPPPPRRRDVITYIR